MSSRKLGNGYSLALHTGCGTHLTLVYFNKLKRGYEQDMVKNMAREYFESNNITEIDLEFDGSHAKRSVKVIGEIEAIISDLQNIFSSFDIDVNQVPHIDLRGNDVDDLNKVITINDFVY